MRYRLAGCLFTGRTFLEGERGRFLVADGVEAALVLAMDLCHDDGFALYLPLDHVAEIGDIAAQPAKRRQTVDPLERANQKMEGRMKGGDPKKAKRKSMMNSYGLS